MHQEEALQFEVLKNLKDGIMRVMPKHLKIKADKDLLESLYLRAEPAVLCALTPYLNHLVEEHLKFYEEEFTFFCEAVACDNDFELTELTQRASDEMDVMGEFLYNFITAWRKTYYSMGHYRGHRAKGQT